MDKMMNETADRIRVGDKVTITPRGKRGIWTAEFNHHGKHCHRSTKTTNLKIARQRALLTEAELATGEYAARARPIAVADAVRQFVCVPPTAPLIF